MVPSDRRQVTASPAVGGNGTIYINSKDGKLHAIAGGAPLAAGPWPKYRRDNLNTGRK